MEYPTGRDPRVGLSESLYHAQIIIETFSRAMEDSQCMSRLPISVYTEAEHHQFRIQETLRRIVSDPDNDPDLEPLVAYEYVIPNDVDSTQVPREARVANDRVPRSSVRDWQQQCIDCGIEIPEFDFDRLLGDMLRNARRFIENILALFGFDLPNLCQVAYMMSFICIPDLIAILAMILAAIIRLLASVVIGSFALAGFILGVIMGIIAALLEYIIAIIAAVLGPVTCLIDSISEVIVKIPTHAKLGEDLSEEEFALLHIDKADPSTDSSPIDDISTATKSYGLQTNLFVKQSFEDVREALRNADDYVQATIDDLFGMVAYLDCEPDRSGQGIAEKVGSVLQMMQIANLVMAIIDKKSLQFSLDKLCNPVEQRDPGQRNATSAADLQQQDITGFTNLEIAEVIEESLAVSATIVEDEEGKEVALLIKNNEDAQPRIGLYNCSLDPIIKDYTLPAIVERADTIVEENLIPDVDYPGFFRPKDHTVEDGERIARTGNGVPSVTRINRISVRDLPIDNIDDTQTQLMQLDQQVDLEDTVGSIVRDIISTKVHAAQEARFRADLEAKEATLNEDISKEVIQESSTKAIARDKALKLRGIKDPDTIPVDDDYSISPSVDNGLVQTNTGLLTGGIIPATSLKVSTQLQCGSIKNIEEQFSLLTEQ